MRKVKPGQIPEIHFHAGFGITACMADPLEGGVFPIMDLSPASLFSIGDENSNYTFNCLTPKLIETGAE